MGNALNLETYLAEFDSAEKIDRGMAGDDKYRCRCGTDEFLLRVADGEDYDEKEKEFAHLKRLSDAGLPVAEQTGVRPFKFNVDMVASAKAVKENGDESFTLGDLLDIYYGKRTYAKYDKSALQWNNFQFIR